MPTATTALDDLDFDFPNKEIRHIDMDLDWDSDTGTPPAVGDYIRGGTSGAIARVIAVVDNTGSGTLTLTDVEGRFQDNEAIETLDSLPFDTVNTANGGFIIGDTYDSSVTTATFLVRAVQYNYAGGVAGAGLLWGTKGGVGAWANTHLIQDSGVNTIATATAAHTAGAVFTGALVNEATNGTGSPKTITGLINYDGGTETIVEDAVIYAGVQASETLTLTANAANNDTVTLDTKTYTFKTTLTGAANEVKIGADGNASIRNLAHAINLRGTIGTDYGLGTTKHTTVEAVHGTTTLTMVAEAIEPGIGGNSISTTEVSAVMSWGATTMSGGSGNTGRGQVHLKNQDATAIVGTLIVNDISGAFADNDTLYYDNVLTYDNLQAGEKFVDGQVVKGNTTGARARIIRVDATNLRIFLAEQRGRFEDNEQIHRVAKNETTTYVADANGADSTLTAATVNHPNAQPCPFVDQKQSLQGGIYSNSLNNVRQLRILLNEISEKVSTTFDDFDDLNPMTGEVKNGQYTMQSGWTFPDLSTRFMSTGSLQDAPGDNIWLSTQSVGIQEAIQPAGNGTEKIQPQLYVLQDGVEVTPFWMEGHMDILVKSKSNTNTKYVSATVGEGVLIDSGILQGFNRFYTHTYSHFKTKAKSNGGQALIPLSTQDDISNNTGTHRFSYTAGAVTWSVGDEITSGSGTTLKVGVVVSADSTLTGNVDYVLKSGTNFVTSDVVTARWTQNTKTVNVVSTLVAGYGDKIGFGHVDSQFTGGTTTGTYQIGEGVTQTGTGATGIILEDNAGALFIDELDALWNGTGSITGDLSGATNTPTARAASATAPKDIGDGIDNNYGTIWGLDKTASGTGRTIAEMFEFMKLQLSKEADATFQLHGGRNQRTAVQGRFYISVDDTDATPLPFVQVPAAAYGVMGGVVFIGATSVFVQDMASGDIQNYNLIDDTLTAESPPNIQPLSIVGGVTGSLLVVYRTTNPGDAGPQLTEYTIGSTAADNKATDSTILLAAGDRTVSPLGVDIPDASAVRCEYPAGSGEYVNFDYSSVDRTNNRFTLAINAAQPNGLISDVTGVGNDLTAADNAYVTLMSRVVDTATESKNIEYNADINVLIKLRKRGFNVLTLNSTFGATGLNASVSQVNNTVVDAI